MHLSQNCLGCGAPMNPHSSLCCQCGTFRADSGPSATTTTATASPASDTGALFSFWAGSRIYREYEAGLKSTLFVGFSGWILVLGLVIPCAWPFLWMGIRFAFFPAGNWVGLGVVTKGMLTWVAIVA